MGCSSLKPCAVYLNPGQVVMDLNTFSGSLLGLYILWLCTNGWLSLPGSAGRVQECTDCRSRPRCRPWEQASCVRASGTGDGRLLPLLWGSNQGHFLQLEYLELTSAGFGVQAATLNRRLRHSVTVPSAGCNSVVSSRCVTGDVTTVTYQSGNCLVGMLCATTATLMSWSKALSGKSEIHP